MGTIRERLVERLDHKIARLKRAKSKLEAKKLEDKKLDHQIQRLVSMRGRLQKQNPTGDLNA